MSANEVVDSGVIMPRIAKVEPLPDATLRIVWAEGRRAGREDVVDLSPAIYSYKIFRPLRGNGALFSTAHLVEDGDVVAWNGDDLEMTADLLQALAEETMNPKDFVAFLARHKLTQEEAGVLLGRSRRQIANYVSVGPIPRVVALACYGFEARKRDAVIAREIQTSAATLGNPELTPEKQKGGKAASVVREPT
ncbi:hypothetical protein DNX69_24695 [Rhodopseudomonas palustris]|uniref:Uncharacterized protein n=1 Tax=Rhodopseudomonas palustris TaxID=1076 RepID=A0A323UAQ1_RHOPL|nr:hypothetical protein [Rhodopseudomonas palustris]PZA09303.1 hypothetical protein DNX69_24695 [Rhodopseudomonas palustris]